MKKVKWLFLLIVLVTAFLNSQFSISLTAGPVSYVPDEVSVDSGYTVDSFHSDIVVNKDGVYNIVETIEVTFKEAEEVGFSHGIYRYIPTRVQAVREIDGKVEKNMYAVEILDAKSLNDEKLTYDGNEDGCDIFRFGSESALVNGQTITYEFSYNYVVPDDRYDSFDDFYFNLVGSGWTNDINNVSFKITFPEVISEGNTFFYSGEVGSSNIADVTLVNTGSNVIEGTLNESVKAGQAFTIRTILPDGYFSEVTKTSKGMKTTAIVLACVLLLAVIGLTFIGGSKTPITPVVNFDPPSGMTPLKMKAFISSSGISVKDLSAMIIYWANKGYLKIVQGENKKFSLVKLKDLDDFEHNQEKKMFDSQRRHRPRQNPAYKSPC